MEITPIKDYLHVVFLQENFEEKKTKSGLIIKNPGEDLSKKVFSAEVVETGAEVNEVEKGDIVYFVNYKPIPMGEVGEPHEKNLTITKEGNVLFKRKKTDKDELIKQNF